MNLKPQHNVLSIRASVVAYVELLASASAQARYERDVPHAFVPGELIEADDQLLHIKSPAYVDAFTDAEHRDLAHLYGLIREAAPVEASTVAELQKRPEWRRVMTLAKNLAVQLNRNANL
ncbi:MAG: hypothetical protein AAF170_00085 [Bacteroidota bacterium]